MVRCCSPDFTFFFNYTATTEIYTLSLHDALPIYYRIPSLNQLLGKNHWTLKKDKEEATGALTVALMGQDRKSTRLNSSHRCISYAVFCLKKKKYNDSERVGAKDKRDLAP